MIFNLKYFSAALLLFFIEVLIAIYVRDAVVRPYGGDFLVVIFLYCLAKSFFRIPVKKAIFGVLIFSFAVEASQLFNFIGLLGLEHNEVASAVLGSHFEWLDILIYILAGLFIFAMETAHSSFGGRSRKTSV